MYIIYKHDKSFFNTYVGKYSYIYKCPSNRQNFNDQVYPQFKYFCIFMHIDKERWIHRYKVRCLTA